MKNLQEIKESIDSSKKLKSIITTMKAHASTKLYHFKNAALSSIRYRSIINKALFVILQGEQEEAEHVPVKDGNTIHIVFGSDQGLAGRFNERMTSFASGKIPKSDKDKVIIVGQQVFNRLEHDYAVSGFFSVPQTEDSISSVIQKILVKIDLLRNETFVEKIFLYYIHTTDEKSTDEIEKLFPIDIESYSQKNFKWSSKSIPVYFDSRENLISDLIKQYFFLTLYRTLCLSVVSENTSRINSMNSAEKNIEENIKELDFEYRKQRQTNITEEINDITSGFKAIKKKEKNI